MSRSEQVKRKPARWGVGDVVQQGNTRWAVRIVVGDHVELEALNVAAGIWWKTTQDRLPEKVVVA